jgi:hypothetical protein
MYLDRLARVAPPRAGATAGAGACRAVACNASTTTFELDNDIFQVPPPANTPGTPGSYGRALVRFHAEGADLYILFGAANTVSANSAATSGNTVCARIPIGQERDYELDPNVDKFCSCTTINGGSLTGTLRYQMVSFPSSPNPGTG